MAEINIEKATAKELLGHFQQKLDEEAREQKKNGKLVCWSASVAPPEMCVTMDIAMVYPETTPLASLPEKVLPTCSMSHRSRGITSTSVLMRA
jgi:hypothetical protein